MSKGTKNVNDASKLQGDLNVIYDWAEINNMTFNDTKFELLRYGKDETLKLCTSYTADTGIVISEKCHVKDLGVTMSSNANFSEHTQQVVSKSYDMCGWIFRTFQTRSTHPMLVLWKQLVIPKLDYCSQLWSPVKVNDIQRLEMVQRNFIRKISGMSDLNYWQQLEHLKLYSLQRRRERYQIIYIWCILEEIVPAVNDVKSKTCPRKGRTCVVPVTKKRSLLE